MTQAVRPFQLLIKPVGPRCNLACRYCFYSGDADPNPSLPPVMPDEVLDTMLRKYMSLRLPESILCWQGGEPTLAGLPFFQRVVELEMQYGRGGQAVSNALQTNGQLIDEAWAEFLAEYRFLVGVSIDGPREIHDAQRIYADGRGSHERAMRATHLLQRAGVEFNILTVVHRGNQDKAREIFQWELDQGWQHLQYIPCTELDSDGNPLPFSCTPEGYGQFLCDLWQAYRETGRRDIGIRTFDSWLSRKVLGHNTLCTFSERCGEYLLVKPDGGLYPCDFFYNDQWRLGNLMTGDLVKAYAEVRENGCGLLKGRRDTQCEECPYLDYCHGGCPKDRFAMPPHDGTGRTPFCESYRMFFDRFEADLNVVADELQREREAHERQRREHYRRIALASGIGRNAPCPCGSGKKFKNCCGRQ